MCKAQNSQINSKAEFLPSCLSCIHYNNDTIVLLILKDYN
ncbi:MAG TPA: hypothetical protein DHV15_05255 [Treponema sp.]|uniref:Uncharacterized protein n=1 Tax=Treponema denticola (strain ATCC 35405 / DSM 14222 / CIP 103919 / JCM 8153 / KCTC 15104) TaxID=243275 RepID=Q73MC6_TREDE|nr:hypothetical protein TDE_1583 [Treponema denticola ATCC 35405]UTY25991.1 hypothetical protein E4N77_04375 [Treponema denticola]HCY94908.1 hypothetical protein [Treponema sp.]